MKTRSVLTIACLLGLFLTALTTCSMADEASPKQILQLADKARGNYEGVKWTIYIDSTENNEKQERHLTVSARGYDFLAVLTNPSKVKGQKLLMVDHNMWFMKPGVKKPVPISSRQKLVGGAAYGDIAATNYADDYEAAVLPEETIDGEDCHVFRLKAITKKATYDEIQYWISKKRLVGIKAEYYTVSGKLFKTATFEYNNQISKDNPAPFISKMTIVDAIAPDNITHLHYKDNKLTKIPDSMFDVNLLMNR